MNAHLAHASSSRLMEYIELLPTAQVRQRARRLYVRSINHDWSEGQLQPLLLQLATQEHRLARTQNGRGSAGQCPATTYAKTPAAGELSNRLAAGATTRPCLPSVRACHGPVPASFEQRSDAGTRVLSGDKRHG